MGRNVRVKTWDEFRRLAIKENPKSIVYIIAFGIPAEDLTSLKLILTVLKIHSTFSPTVQKAIN